MSTRHFCGKCSHELPANASFCPNCKVRISGSRDMNKLDRKFIQERIDKENVIRRQQQKEIDIRNQYLYIKNKKINYIKDLADQSKIDRYPKFINLFLASLRIKRIVKTLNFDFKDKNELVNIDAVRAFTNIGKTSLKPILTALNNQKSQIRIIAIKSLVSTSDKRSIEPLIQLLEDEDIKVRESAANTLYYIGDDRAVLPLIKTLGDDDALVREKVAFALTKLGDKRAVDALIKILKDENTIRYHAAIALGNIGDEKAVDSLIKSLNGKYPIIAEYRLKGENYKEAAAFALGKIGTEKALEGLMKAKKSSDPKVCQSAVKVLDKVQN